MQLAHISASIVPQGEPMHIKILRPCCARCSQTEQFVALKKGAF